MHSKQSSPPPRGTPHTPHKLKPRTKSRASGLSNGETGGDARKRRLPPLPSASDGPERSCPHGSHTFAHAQGRDWDAEGRRL